MRQDEQQTKDAKPAKMPIYGFDGGSGSTTQNGTTGGTKHDLGDGEAHEQVEQRPESKIRYGFD